MKTSDPPDVAAPPGGKLLDNHRTGRSLVALGRLADGSGYCLIRDGDTPQEDEAISAVISLDSHCVQWERGGANGRTRT